ncbi:transcriptional regulator [Zunongwangia profunda SM-A87]|uniref:Transcriptional regulator n=1 Tax=Zunongwangia profunda (strain DSM 18752 / CCTCC AB 206139 / SM-A87) TaxID=655815 RepID=D5BE72_ZUNPS|nr:AraC family transcriptional regulator [Zunongwangia profunda]ADF52831.1 transcriptional regulator [Zunongwangia profunda SM-A87]
MEFIFHKIYIPNNHSFITRELDLTDDTIIHSHKNIELNYIVSGTGRRIVGDNISNFEKGDLVLMGAELPHCWELLDADKNEKPRCIVTHFSEEILLNEYFKMPELQNILLLINQASRGIQFKVENDREILNILLRLSKSEGLEYYISLLQIFNLLLKIEDKKKLSNPLNQSSIFSNNIEKINKIYEYVFLNIQEGINLEEASSVINMAPSSFCRFFKKKTGITFMEYVKNVRVGMAAKLLAETDKQITEICYESGYNNLANFNHYFKVSMGVTPTEYRKNFR